MLRACTRIGRLNFAELLDAVRTAGAALRGVVVAINMVPPTVIPASALHHAAALQQKTEPAVYAIHQALRSGRGHWPSSVTAAANACEVRAHAVPRSNDPARAAILAHTFAYVEAVCKPGVYVTAAH